MAPEAADMLAAARRRFPDRSGRIERLAALDEAFRDMCEELTAAEEARARIANLTGDGSRERRLECEDWITRLHAEMEAALLRAEMPARWRR